MTTINISLPKSLLDEAKKMLKTKHYASISELVRHSLRKTLAEEDPNAISVNGFPNWFEDMVLEREKESDKNDIVLETSEDIDKYFDKLHRRLEKKRYAKNQKQ